MSLTGDQFRTAAGFVREGWIQHRVVDEKGHVCLFGALSKVKDARVYPPFWDESHLHRILAQHLDPNAGARSPSLSSLSFRGGISTSGVICNWNNAPERTAEEVALKLEEVARLEDEKELLIKKPVEVREFVET